MKRKPEVPGKQLTVRVPPEVHRAVKVRAAEEGRSAAVLAQLPRWVSGFRAFAAENLNDFAGRMPEISK